MVRNLLGHDVFFALVYVISREQSATMEPETKSIGIVCSFLYIRGIGLMPWLHSWRFNNSGRVMLCSNQSSKSY